VSTAPVPRSPSSILSSGNPPSRNLEKLRAKISHNLHLGLVAFAKKSVNFVTASARSRYLLREVNHLGVGVRVIGLPPKISNRGGQVLIGDDVIFDAKLTPIYLELIRDAVLTIGNSTYINDGVWFGCTGRITIGARVLIGPGVRIFDNSYHGIYQRRVMPAPRPVTIEDDVWIATNSIILAGVTIGRGAIVGANSVVSKDVPAYSIVAGNPARQINVLDPAIFEATQQHGPRRAAV
jgi:acetyltransferase-like isoleucine patch superfamily enzyme